MIQQREWTFIDKSMWKDGPWKDEPDKIQWQDSGTGLPCLIRRTELGNLCGYVGVDKTHFLYQRHYSDCFLDVPCDESYCTHSPDSIADVHGGLTYSNLCQDEDTEHGICHVEDSADMAWWFGFDCAHAYDLIPAININLPADIQQRLDALEFKSEDVYRGISYVRKECGELAMQLFRLQQKNTAT